MDMNSTAGLPTIAHSGATPRNPGTKVCARSKKVNTAFALKLLAATMLLGALNVYAANRYVRAGGAGTRDGSDWNNAYSSLPTTLIRANTYYVADGSYSGRTFSTPVSGTTPITIKKATTQDHGTSAGWTDTLGDGQAIFTSGLNFASSYWIFDGKTGGGAKNNWRDGFGFKITETKDGSAVIKVGQSGTANYITVRHVQLQGKGSVSNAGGSASNDGLAIYGASNITLSYFRMTGIGRCPFFISPRDAVIEHGWVESYFGSSSVHSEVASIWAFSGNVGDVTFRYNLFTDIKSTGGIMWDSSSNNRARLDVYGNVFYKPAGARWDTANGVIGGWTGGNGEKFSNVSVYNNSFINVDQESLSTFPNIYSGNVAYNNLFYNSQSPNFAKFASHDFNHFIDSGGSHSEPNGTSAVSGDPFVNYVGLDFRLKAPTVSGTTLTSPYDRDPLRKIRGADGLFDRGANEFGDTQRLSPPASLRGM